MVNKTEFQANETVTITLERFFDMKNKLEMLEKLLFPDVIQHGEIRLTTDCIVGAVEILYPAIQQDSHKIKTVRILNPGRWYTLTTEFPPKEEDTDNG